MKSFKIIAVVIAALSISGCTQLNLSKADGGTLLGAAAGGLIGSKIGKGRGQLAATAIGTLFGAAVGRDIGASLDKMDRMYAARTTQVSLEKTRTGKTSRWSNPDSGHSGTVTPRRTYTKSNGAPCREYQTTVMIGGRTETAYGTACRRADGSWQIS